MTKLEEALIDMPIPKDEEGPIFEEPWQAQAFALTVKLNEAGHFTWPEWADMFGAEIAIATREGRGCGNEDYYLCWLAALEKLVAEKGIVTEKQLLDRKEAWRHASEHTEHGKPIELGAGH